MKIKIDKEEIYYTLFRFKITPSLKKSNIEYCYLNSSRWSKQLHFDELFYKLTFRSLPNDFDKTNGFIQFKWKRKNLKNYLLHMFITIPLWNFTSKHRQQILNILTEHWQLIDSENLEPKKPKQ